MSAIRFLGATLLLVSPVVGCTDAKPKADTARTADTTTGPAENLEPAQPPAAEPRRLGQMPLLRGAPADGLCDSTITATEKRIVLEGDAPLRRITVGVSLTAGRPFVPVYLDVKSKQSRGDGQEENETIFVGFTGTGAIDSGRRQYFVTGAAPKEAGKVSPEEFESAKQLALQVLQRCKAGG